MQVQKPDSDEGELVYARIATSSAVGDIKARVYAERPLLQVSTGIQVWMYDPYFMSVRKDRMAFSGFPTSLFHNWLCSRSAAPESHTAGRHLTTCLCTQVRYRSWMPK